MSSYTMTSPRILSATGLGLVATVGLFYVMTVLIRGDDLPVFIDPPTTTITFLPVLEDEPVVRNRRVDPPPDPIEEPPTARIVEATELTVPVEVKWTGPVVRKDLPGPELGVSDGEAVPLVTSVPEYPPRAQTLGIQGWVIVEFTIDPQGKVVAPSVVEGQPSGIFDRAALKAIARYKYKPRVVNGEGVSVEGIRQRIVFELKG